MMCPFPPASAATRCMSGWGLKFFDYDNDGNIDLFLSNGHPDDRVEKRVEHVTYREPLLLFRKHPTASKMSASKAARFSQSPSLHAAWRSAISITMARSTY